MFWNVKGIRSYRKIKKKVESHQMKKEFRIEFPEDQNTSIVTRETQTLLDEERHKGNDKCTSRPYYKQRRNIY